jgi:hypothetical protein
VGAPGEYRCGKHRRVSSDKTVSLKISLKVLHGGFSMKDRPTHTQKPVEPIPAPPDHLSERAKGLWSAILNERRMQLGRLTTFRTSLEVLDRADAAMAEIKNQLMLTTERSGCQHLNPLLKLEKENRQLFWKMWTGLGLHINVVKSPFPVIDGDE